MALGGKVRWGSGATAPLSGKSSPPIQENITNLSGKLFNANTRNLRCDIATFKFMIARKSEKEHRKSLLQLQGYLEKLKKAFFEPRRIALIACVLGRM